jgi:hypothetical protein
MTKNIKNLLLELQFTCPQASRKDFQATEEALSTYKRTSTSTSKHMKFLNFYLLLWVTFALLDPDPDTYLLI